ncbi:MAG: carbohydrate binding family 9 domain-containing protein [Bacteroidetes bacterium]|nr:carbohydrate binding family 9 domain-containing protein [Bacteroidota bacterium]
MIFLFIVLSGSGQLIPTCQPDCIVEAASATSLILIDGVLDEEDWQQASPAMEFLQATPKEGELATFKTQVRILHDQRVLYVGATLHDTEPHRIRRTLGPRDQFNHADWFSIALDANNDKQSAFHFAVNAAGGRVEGFEVDGIAPSKWTTSDVFGEELFQFDPSWDAEWTAKVKVDSVGWTLEMAIPISLLRITSLRNREWGINFRRWVARAAEFSEWAPTPLQERNGGTVARFGTLRLSQTVRPTIHRYGYMHALVANLRSQGDDRAATIPVPGMDGGLAVGRNIFLQASLIPEIYPEDIKVYIDDFSGANPRGPNYSHLFPASSQFIASTASGSNQLFDRLTGASCLVPLVGGTSLHGRLPGRVSLAGIGKVFLPLDQGFYVPNGFTGRIQKDVGEGSRIGVSGAVEPSNPEGNETTTPFEGIISGVSMDWDIRSQRHSSRWAGQIGVSQAASRNYCNRYSDQDSHPSEVRDGIAARVEYGQLGKAYNWFTRIKMTHPDYMAPPTYQWLLPGRTEVVVGVRHARVNGSGLITQGQFNVAISQWLAYSDFTPKETILTGQAAALTSGHNQITLSIHAGIQSSRHLRFGTDASVSTDIRRRLVLTPRVGLNWIQNGLQISHGLINIKGGLGTWLTLDTQIMATHASGNMNSPTWLSEFLASEPTFTAQRDDMHPSVQCRSGFGVEDTRAKSSHCVRAYAFAKVGLSLRLNFEVGVHALGIGTRDHLNRQVMEDGRADVVGRFRWEFKPGTFVTLGANWGRSVPISSDPEWKHILDLLTTPLRGNNYHIFSFSINRRLQR